MLVMLISERRCVALSAGSNVIFHLDESVRQSHRTSPIEAQAMRFSRSPEWPHFSRNPHPLLGLVERAIAPQARRVKGGALRVRLEGALGRRARANQLDASGAGREHAESGGPERGTRFRPQRDIDVTGLTIDVALGAEAGAALGAARLGMLAAGAGSVKSVCARPPTQRAFEPDAESAALHAPRLRRYRALYKAEKGVRVP